MHTGVEQVSTLEFNSRVALGTIARQNLVVHQARKPPGSALSAIPTNDTARKAMSLDTQRATVDTNTPTNEDRPARKIKPKINGSLVELMVNVNPLRQELDLPLHDLFDSGVYHGRVHSETVGADIEDTDNGASAVPQLKQSRTSPPRKPKPQLQFLLQEPFGEVVVDYETNTDVEAI